MYFYRRGEHEPSCKPEDAGKVLAAAAHYFVGGRPVHAVCLTTEDRAWLDAEREEDSTSTSTKRGMEP